MTTTHPIPALPTSSPVSADKAGAQDVAHAPAAYSEMSPHGTASGADALSCAQLPRPKAVGGFFKKVTK